jgi:hypothetical protein
MKCRHIFVSATELYYMILPVTKWTNLSRQHITTIKVSRDTRPQQIRCPWISFISYLLCMCILFFQPKLLIDTIFSRNLLCSFFIPSIFNLYVLNVTSSISPTIKSRWYGRGEMTSYDIGQYFCDCQSNIPPPMCEPWLLALPAPDQARPWLRAQRTLVRVEYVQWKIVWPVEIEPKTSALVPC